MAKFYDSKKDLNLQDEKNWSYDHFLCYLLLYASYADYDFSAEEKKHILSLVDSSTLTSVESYFNTLGAYEQLDQILRLKRKFIKSPDHKAQLFRLLHDLFGSDGEISKLETGLYNFLEKLI